MSRKVSSASSTTGGDRVSQRSPALALATIAPSGCLISWAIEAVIADAMVRQLAPDRPQVVLGTLELGDVAPHRVDAIAVRRGRPRQPTVRAVLVAQPAL